MEEAPVIQKDGEIFSDLPLQYLKMYYRYTRVHQPLRACIRGEECKVYRRREKIIIHPSLAEMEFVL